MAEIMAASPPGMVTVGMRDHGPVHGLPGVYIKTSLRAANAFIGEFEKHGDKAVQANG
jgi:hypothetical protein